MLQLFVKWEDYFLIVLWIQSVSSWKLIHSVQSALQNKLCLAANSAVAVTKRLMSLQNKLRCSNFSVRHQQISVDFWFPQTQDLKKKKKAKPNSFLDPHMWYNNEIKRKQANGKRHILVLMRKQLSDFSCNGVPEEICMFRRVFETDCCSYISSS